MRYLCGHLKDEAILLRVHLPAEASECDDMREHVGVARRHHGCAIRIRGRSTARLLAVTSSGSETGRLTHAPLSLPMASTMALQPKSSTDDLDNGGCAMRGSCGGVSAFDPSLPCPYDGPPEDVSQPFLYIETSCG